MEPAPTHADISARIEQVESGIKQWTLTGVWKAAIVVVPLMLGAIISFAAWTSQAHSDQQKFNADINARVQGNKEAFEQARNSQSLMMSKLDEIHRFMREDSKEQREALADHIRQARCKE